MHDLALERVHWRQRYLRVRVLGLRYGFGRESHELLPAALAVAGNIKHQSAAAAGLTHDGQPSQLLKCVEHLAVRTDQDLGIADDRDVRAVAFDVGIDVPGEVE